MINYIEIIESDIENLLKLRGQVFADRESELYYPIFLSYLMGDIHALNKSVQIVRNESRLDPRLTPIALIGDLRLSIRTKNELQTNMDKLIKFDMTDPKWLGESYSVISTAASLLEMYELAKDYSLLSAREFKRIGARRKAVRMLMNSISSESNMRPDKNYLSDLFFIYKEAKKVGDSISVGNTLINLSREYQKLGLYNAAVKYASRAIAVLTNHSAGGLDFHMALVQRADINCHLGAFYDAQIDIEMAKACEFFEVQGAIKLVCEKFPQIKLQVKANNDEYYITPNWKGRNKEDLVKKVSKHESILIELLVQGPQTRRQLCEKIYGERLAIEVKEKRFDNLLSRIRKRNPKLIICQNSRYHLVEKPVFPTFLIEVNK